VTHEVCVCDGYCDGMSSHYDRESVRLSETETHRVGTFFEPFFGSFLEALAP